MHRILAFVVLLALGAGGYANGPAWLVPAAAAFLTLADWQPWRLARQVRAPWSSKAAAYLVSGFIAQLVMAALAFGAGRLLHRLLG